MIITLPEICPNGSGKGWENIGTGSLEEVFALYLSQGQLGVHQQGKRREKHSRKRRLKEAQLVGEHSFRAYQPDNRVELENGGSWLNARR